MSASVRPGKTSWDRRVEAILMSIVLPLAMAIIITSLWLLIEKRPESIQLNRALLAISMLILMPEVILLALLNARTNPGMFGSLIQVLPPNQGSYLRMQDWRSSS